ncbi:GFA family protein [Piscinibacter sp. HJYY11]|uniref:GFA family protein n=1 Tax=Piscinibacter sp. HJYY11 TaxID=2801333 RepID=UPI00191EB689|nr:GFA family protein [Piscinibacter sp. HJYY11]MBL0730461.1 GFA family protein [Piscinibacter sp. HJYY11]
MTYTARCLCGGISLRLEGELAPIQICHCSQCRQAQGGAFAANIPVDASKVHVDSGTELMSEYEATPGKKRVFCRRCGSPIYSARENLPGVLRIRAGLITEPLAARPGFHMHVASKANWYEIHDGLPQHSQGHVPPSP